MLGQQCARSFLLLVTSIARYIRVSHITQSQQNRLKALEWKQSKAFLCSLERHARTPSYTGLEGKATVRLHKGTDVLSAKLQHTAGAFQARHTHDGSRVFAMGNSMSCLLLTLNPRGASPWGHKLHHLRGSVCKKYFPKYAKNPAEWQSATRLLTTTCNSTSRR